VGIIRSKLLVGSFSPFSETKRCYGGSEWFTCNRKAVDRLLAQNAYYKQKFTGLQEQFPGACLLTVWPQIAEIPAAVT